MNIKKLKTWIYLGCALILFSGIFLYFWIYECQNSSFCLSYINYVNPVYKPLYGLGGIILIILGATGLIIVYILSRIEEYKEYKGME